MLVRRKLELCAGGFVALQLITATVFVFLTGDAEVDGLRISLCARQRLLTQQMAVETLQVARADSPAALQEGRERLAATVGSFDSTLRALLSGGVAVDGEGAERRLPPISHAPAIAALEAGLTRWLRLGPVLQRIAAGQILAGSREWRAVEPTIMEDAALLGTTMHEATNATQRAHDSRRRTLLIVQTIVTAVPALLLALLVWVTVRRRVSAPLARAVELARAVAGGDLQRELDPGTQHDEVADLWRSLNEMAASLRAVMLRIMGSVTTMNRASGDAAASASQLSQGVQMQTTSILEITTTITELQQTLELSLEKAGGVVEVGDRSADAARAGHASVRECVAAMETIRTQMDDIARTILDLAQKTEQVGVITDSVNDLAERSTLLAVNASIEAARAGEQGRGFSAVAAEVKALAGQSKQATQKVKRILEDIQGSTGRVVLAMEEGSKRVSRGVELVEQAGRSVQQLATTVEDVVAAGRQIAASAGQQYSGFESVTGAMASIRDSAEQSQQLARAQEQVSQDLRQLAVALDSEVSRYSFNGRSSA